MTTYIWYLPAFQTSGYFFFFVEHSCEKPRPSFSHHMILTGSQISKMWDTNILQKVGTSTTFFFLKEPEKLLTTPFLFCSKLVWIEKRVQVQQPITHKNYYLWLNPAWNRIQPGMSLCKTISLIYLYFRRKKKVLFLYFNTWTFCCSPSADV